MKKVLKWTLGLVGGLFVTLLLTCPNEADYDKWLSSEHQINCVNTGVDVKCTKQGIEVERQARHFRNAGVYFQVEDGYADGNKVYEIKAIGILKHFFDYSSITTID